MNNPILIAAAFALLSVVPAQAQDKMDKGMSKMECTDAEMTKMNTKMDGMSADSKKMAMDHMKMAKESMAKGDMTNCQMHMGKAMDAMDKK